MRAISASQRLAAKDPTETGLNPEHYEATRSGSDEGAAHDDQAFSKEANPQKASEKGGESMDYSAANHATSTGTKTEGKRVDRNKNGKASSMKRSR